MSRYSVVQGRYPHYRQFPYWKPYIRYIFVSIYSICIKIYICRALMIYFKVQISSLPEIQSVMKKNVYITNINISYIMAIGNDNFDYRISIDQRYQLNVSEICSNINLCLNYKI